MKRINLCTLLFTVMLVPDVVMAQACPATDSNNASFRRAKVYGDAPTAFFNNVSTCTTVKIGSAFAPSLCLDTVIPGAGLHWLYAQWPATAARESAASMSPSAGCRFYCGAGASPAARNTCIVKAADGLPVELMEFSVDE